MKFSEWFEKCAPVNGRFLKLRKALKVIRMKIVSLKLLKENDMFHMFLGIDESRYTFRHKGRH